MDKILKIVSGFFALISGLVLLLVATVLGGKLVSKSKTTKTVNGNLSVEVKDADLEEDKATADSIDSAVNNLK